MEAMIFHFKQVMEGVKPPVGEAYLGVENPKGELGYYFVSDGTAKPVRWRIRPAVVHQPGQPAQDVRGRAPVRRDRDQRQRGHRDGRGGPMSAHGSGAAPHAAAHEPVFAGDGPGPAGAALHRSIPTKQACLLPALWMVQEARGWISEPAIGEVAEVLGAHAGLREGRGDVLHHVPHPPGRAALHPGLHHVARATSAARRTW